MGDRGHLKWHILLLLFLCLIIVAIRGPNRDVLCSPLFLQSIPCNSPALLLAISVPRGELWRFDPQLQSAPPPPPVKTTFPRQHILAQLKQLDFQSNRCTIYPAREQSRLDVTGLFHPDGK